MAIVKCRHQITNQIGFAGATSIPSTSAARRRRRPHFFIFLSSLLRWDFVGNYCIDEKATDYIYFSTYMQVNPKILEFEKTS